MAVKNMPAYLGTTFSSSVIAAIKNGSQTNVAVKLSDSNRADGRATVDLVSAGDVIIGVVERDISGDALDVTSVDSGGNVTYPAMGTVKLQDAVWVTKIDTTSGRATAGTSTDIGKGITGFDGGTANAPVGNVQVGAVTDKHKIIAYSGNRLRVILGS